MDLLTAVEQRFCLREDIAHRKMNFSAQWDLCAPSATATEAEQVTGSGPGPAPSRRRCTANKNRVDEEQRCLPLHCQGPERRQPK